MEKNTFIKTNRNKIILLLFILLSLAPLNALAYYNGSTDAPELGSGPVKPDYELRKKTIIGDASIYTYATINSIGLSISVPIQYYTQYKPIVKFKKSTETTWKQAHALTVSEYDRYRYPSEYWWYGSIVSLDAGILYDIMVSIGTDNAPSLYEGALTIQTRAEPGSGTITKTIYVSTSGDDINPGTFEKPLRNIQTAVYKATAGTKVKVLPGSYNEIIVIQNNGSPNNPIVLEGGEGVILDGHSAISGTWNYDGDGLYHIAINKYPSSIDVNTIMERKRIYEYCSSSGFPASDFNLDDLRGRAAEVEDLSTVWAPHYSVSGGWYYDSVNKLLYLRDYQNRNVNEINVWTGSSETAISINGNYIIVQGFDIRYFKRAVSSSGKRFNIIRKNNIFRCLEGIYYLLQNNINGENLSGLPLWSAVGTAGTETKHNAGCLNEGNIIEYNTITDPDTYSWGYGRGKSKPTIETTAVQTSGPGTIIRNNYVKGYFKGISISWDVDQTNRDLGRDTDVYDNIICESMSDALEPEGNLINVRIWGNRVRDMWTGVSIAPVRYGPMYVFRNIFLNHGLTGFKLSSDSKGKTYLYHNTVKTAVPNVAGWNDSGYWHNVTWKNNIIISNYLLIMDDDSGSTDNGLDLDYNLYYTPFKMTDWPVGSIMQFRKKWFSSVADIYKWFGESSGAAFNKALEKNGLFGEVKFIQGWPEDDFFSNRTFKPKENSMNIDRGVFIPNFSLNFSDNAPDIGAIEYAGPKSPANLQRNDLN